MYKAVALSRQQLVSELAVEYGFTDVDGKVPPPPSRDPTPLSVFKPADGNPA